MLDWQSRSTVPATAVAGAAGVAGGGTAGPLAAGAPPDGPVLAGPSIITRETSVPATANATTAAQAAASRR